MEHLGLAAREPVKLAGWYARVLDGREILSCENPGRPPTIFVELPGGLIVEIYPTSHAIPDTAVNSLAGWRHLALQVASLDAARADLAARGVRFEEQVKPAGGGGRVLFFQDPEGNLLHLVERPADSVFRPAQS